VEELSLTIKTQKFSTYNSSKFSSSPIHWRKSLFPYLYDKEL
jgi:hypothetical protein